jgi:hypothetical protein
MNIQQTLRAIDRAHFRSIQKQHDLEPYVGCIDLEEKFPPEPIFELDSQPGVH